MRAVLALEWIGENLDAHCRLYDKEIKKIGGGLDLGYKSNRPWVARITGFDARFGLAREFVRGQKDYSQANSVGSRGVYLYFPLKDGLHEVYRHLTWAKDKRYFIRVEHAEIIEMSREEVEQCLKSVG